MKICFAGLGSIARRHIINLKEIWKDDAEITVLRSGKGEEADEEIKRKISRICTKPEELENKYDAVFITNPSSLHYDTLKKFLGYSNAFFIEKPVFVTGREEISLFSGLGKIYYAACPLRYSKTIQYLKTNIDFKKVFAIRCICSSYLPEWRTGTDYRNLYSASRQLGGGVSLDLIHEWDYLVYLTGFPQNVKSMISKKSKLEIDSDDIAVYIAEYPDKIVEIHLDYFGRKPMRQIELFMEDDTITADLNQHYIRWMKAEKEVRFTEQRDDYQQAELVHFFKIAAGQTPNDNGLETACRMLQTARGEL